MLSALPLTAFEAYMWADDAPDHPMTALIEIAYEGRLDRDRFQAALAATLGEHPLLRSLIESSGRRSRWRSQPVAPVLCWDSDDVPLQYPNGSEYIDLTRESGLRAWVRAGESAGRIVFQLHHACTDGIGVLNFVFDLCRAYAANESGDRPVRRDISRLVERDRFFRRKWLGRLTMLGGAAFRSRRWRTSRSIPLGRHSVGTSASLAPMEAIRCRDVAADDLEGLRAVARDAGVTLNDLLLRELFVLLADRCGRNADPDECICLCMPVNLREPADLRMPAANKMMMSFLRRTPADCLDADGLLRNIHSETLTIKRTRRGLRVLEVLRLSLALFGQIPSALLRKNCFATAVLSNLGRLEAADIGLPADVDGRLLCGDVTIDRIVTAPNGRPGTAATFVVITYGGRLTISLRFDPKSLSADDAEHLLNAYVERLSRTAHGDHEPVTPDDFSVVDKNTPATAEV